MTASPPPSGRRRPRALPARVAPDDPDRAAKVGPHIARLAWLLDDAVPVPGTGARVGLDGLVGLIPGVGDLAGLVAGLVIVGAGVAANVSLPTLVRMLFHVGLRSVVGLVPVAGDAFDLAYKSNERNVRLIEADLADRARTRRTSLLMIVASVAIAAAGVLLTLAAMAWVVYRLVTAW